MIVDFQHHYTPPELMDKSKDASLTRLNSNQDPILRLTPLLADLPAHVRMMDQAGIDAAVLSCLQGFDEPHRRHHQGEFPAEHPSQVVRIHVPPADDLR